MSSFLHPSFVEAVIDAYGGLYHVWDILWSLVQVSNVVLNDIFESIVELCSLCTFTPSEVRVDLLETCSILAHGCCLTTASDLSFRGEFFVNISVDHGDLLLEVVGDWKYIYVATLLG